MPGRRLAGLVLPLGSKTQALNSVKRSLDRPAQIVGVDRASTRLALTQPLHSEAHDWPHGFCFFGFASDCLEKGKRGHSSRSVWMQPPEGWPYSTEPCSRSFRHFVAIPPFPWWQEPV